MYGVAGCPYVRGCNSIELNDRSVRTLVAVCYIHVVDVRNTGVSVKRGFTVNQIRDYMYMYIHRFWGMEFPNSRQ